MATTGDKQTLSANGKTTARNYVGPVCVSVDGTFGGGTFKIEAEDPLGVVKTVVGTTRTADDNFRIDFPDGAENKINADLTGATTPVLDIVIQGVARGA